MTLAEIIEYINENVTRESQLEGMRGMGLDLTELPESYRAKKQKTNSGIEYYICNRNEKTRNKMYEKLVSNIISESTDAGTTCTSQQKVIRNNTSTMMETKEIERTCSACGTKLSADALFCHMCGEKYENLQQQKDSCSEEFDDFFATSDEDDLFATTFDIGNLFNNASRNSDILSEDEEEAGKPDLVAENALLSPCPDTECTHTKEYYYKVRNFGISLYNNRLYYIKDNFRMKHGVWCSKEDGSQEFCLIDDEEIRPSGTDPYTHLVTNYYGIFVYALNSWGSKSEYHVKKYDFAGKLEKKIELVKNMSVEDIYIYGSKIFYIAYSDFKEIDGYGYSYNYYVGYCDINTGERKQLRLPDEKKKITRICGNNKEMFYYIEDNLMEEDNRSSEEKPYDPLTGWCRTPLDKGNTLQALKELLYPKGLKLRTEDDEWGLPWIQFIDVKNNLIWYCEMCYDTKQNWSHTMLMAGKLDDNRITKVEGVEAWKFERGFKLGNTVYFDGERCYMAEPHSCKIFSYNRAMDKYQVNECDGHGAYEYSIILGDYLYTTPVDWHVQYTTQHDKSEKVRKITEEFYYGYGL